MAYNLWGKGSGVISTSGDEKKIKRKSKLFLFFHFHCLVDDLANIRLYRNAHNSQWFDVRDTSQTKDQDNEFA